MIRRTYPDPAAVRTLRERLRWTPEQMADAVQAMPRDVTAWEAGTVRVPRARARRLRALAIAHGVRPGHLGYGTDSVPRALRILRLVVVGSVVVVVGSVVLTLERFVLRPLLRPRAVPAPRRVPGPGAAGEPDDEPIDVLTPPAGTVDPEEPPPGFRGFRDR